MEDLSLLLRGQDLPNTVIKHLEEFLTATAAGVRESFQPDRQRNVVACRVQFRHLDQPVIEKLHGGHVVVRDQCESIIPHSKK